MARWAGQGYERRIVMVHAIKVLIASALCHPSIGKRLNRPFSDYSDRLPSSGSVVDVSDLARTAAHSHSFLPSPEKASGPSLREVLLVTTVSLAAFVAIVAFLDDYWGRVVSFGDNPNYLESARAIRRWKLAEVIPAQFLGTSYATAALSAMTLIPETLSLIVMSWCASLAAVVLCYRLWGRWVAVLFALLSWDWTQRSVLGGAEPLFVLLIFAALWYLRKDSWLLAAA